MLLYQEGPVFCSLDAFRVPTSPSSAQQIPWGIRVLAPTKERPDWESHSPSVEDDRNSPGTDCPIQGFASPSVPTEEMFGSFKATRHLSLGFLSDNIFPIVHSHGPYGEHRVRLLETCSLASHLPPFQRLQP